MPSPSNSPNANPASPKVAPKMRDKPESHVPIFPPAQKLIPLSDKAPGEMHLRWQIPDFDTWVERDLPESFEVNGYRDPGVKFRGRTWKNQLISKILSRWWYVFPQWPHPDPTSDGRYSVDGTTGRFPFDELLKDSSKTPTGLTYEAVQIKDYLGTNGREFRDKTGNQKCWEREHFPGLFLTDVHTPVEEANFPQHVVAHTDHEKTDVILDMRPVETCPCFAILSRKPATELVKYMVRAFDNQIDIVKAIVWDAQAANNKSKTEVFKTKLSELKKEQKICADKYTLESARVMDDECGYTGSKHGYSTHLYRPLYPSEKQMSIVNREVSGTTRRVVLPVDLEEEEKAKWARTKVEYLEGMGTLIRTHMEEEEARQMETGKLFLTTKEKELYKEAETQLAEGFGKKGRRIEPKVHQGSVKPEWVGEKVEVP